MTDPVSVGLVVSPVVGCVVDSTGAVAVAVSSQSPSEVCDEEVVSDGDDVGTPDTLGVGVTVPGVEIVLLLEAEVVGITGLLVEVLDVRDVAEEVESISVSVQSVLGLGTEFDGVGTREELGVGNTVIVTVVSVEVDDEGETTGELADGVFETLGVLDRL